MSKNTQLAVVVGSDKKSFAVRSIDIPKHGAREVLVKVYSAAQNPTDCRYYNHPQFNPADCLDTGKTLEFGFSAEGFVPGCDYAGVVQEIGSSVKKVKKGDRVLRASSSAKMPLPIYYHCRLLVSSTVHRCGRGTAPTPNLFEWTVKTCSGFPKAFRLMRPQPMGLRSRPLLWDSIIRSSCRSPTMCMIKRQPPSSSGVALVSLLIIFKNFKLLRCYYVRLSRHGSHSAR